MKSFEFVPTACRDTEATENSPARSAEFRGSVTLKRPTFDDRFAFAEEAGIEIDKKGEVSEHKSPIPMIRKMVRFSKPFYEKVELEKIATGEKYTSVDELDVDPDCTNILIEVAGILFQGKISKN